MDLNPVARALGVRAEAVASLFRARLVGGEVPALVGDAALELSSEVRCVAEALLFGLGATRAAVPEALEFKEAFALTALWGRRASSLGLSPTATLQLCPALLLCLSAQTPIDTTPLLDPLRGVCLEGYVAEQAEREVRASRRCAAGAIATLWVEPSIAIFAPFGEQGRDELEEVVDELSRQLLRRGAEGLLVHLGGLKADAESGRAVFGAQEGAKMLGIRCVFTDISAEWVEAAERAGMCIDEIEQRSTLDEGLRWLLQEAGVRWTQKRSLLDTLRGAWAGSKG